MKTISHPLTSPTVHCKTNAFRSGSPRARILAALVFWILLLPAFGQYVVDFEGAGETKGGYASGIVTLSGLDWDLTQALIGTDANDMKNGARAARIRLNSGVYGALTMLENKPYGIGTVSFLYSRANFSGDRTGTAPRFVVEYSIDDGSTWVQTGKEVNLAGVDELTLFFSEVYIAEEARIRIRQTGGTSGKRWNVDDIVITDFSVDEGICGFENFENGTLPSSYDDGTFPGLFGVSWNYGHSRDEEDFPIDGAGIMLRRASDSYLEATIKGGIRAFSFDYRKAFTGEAVRQLELIVDGEQVATTPVFGNFSGADATIYTFTHYLNTPDDVTIRIKNVGTTSTNRHTVIDNISWSCFEPCVNTTYFFRTKSTGNWNDIEVWETSESGDENWHPSNCIPDVSASRITISEGHKLIVSEDISLDQLLIQENGYLEIVNDKAITFSDKTPESLIIEANGIIEFNGGLASIFTGNAHATIKPLGIVRVSSNKGGISSALAGNESSGKFFYESGSIFEWNNGTSYITDNQVYFPDADEGTIPIFRITGNTTDVGANNNTEFRGIFDAHGNITFRNSGEKIFRNGITGPGTVTQHADCGLFTINGSTAQLSASIQLNGPGLQLSSPDISLTGNTHISDGDILLSGTLDAGTHTLTLGGDLNVTGQLIAHEATLEFSGESPQSLLLNQPLELAGLHMNNSDGLSPDNDITVTQTLTMTAGTIFNTAAFTLGSSGEAPGNLIYHNGQINGTFSRWVSGDENGEMLFPVGKPDMYNPARVQFTTLPAAGILTAEFITDIPTGFYGNLPIEADNDIVIDNLSERGYWQIEGSHSFESGTYTLSLDVSGFDGITNEDRVRIVKRSDGENWVYDGDFLELENSIITQTGMKGFSDFALGGNYDDNNALPIQLISFTATPAPQHVDLHWKTATEINNDFFTLQRSTDLQHIETIGYMQGAGHSNQVLSYHFADKHPVKEGITYYRLKQTDFDGSYAYSHWISAQPDGTPSHPEIVTLRQLHGHVHLMANVTAGQNVLLEVFDIFGRKVYHTAILAQSSLLEYTFPVPQRGVLILRLSDTQNSVKAKLLTY